MKIVSFAPHADLWVHAFPEGLVAETLARGGHEVHLVTCGRALADFCIPMAARGMMPNASPEDKEHVCRSCELNSSLLRSGLAVASRSLDDLVGRSEREQIASDVAKLDRQGCLDLSNDGLPVGRLALFNSIIRYKRTAENFSDEQFEGFRADLRTSLYTLHATRKLFDEVKPDRILVANSLYAVNRIVCALAEQRGMPYYFMHCGQNLSNRLQTLMLGRGDVYSFLYHQLEHWPRHRDLTCNREALSLVSEHLLELLRGQSAFVYSAPKAREYVDIRGRFGIAPGQKLVVAVMSSYDEAFASQAVGAMRPATSSAFPTQIEWVQALAEFVAKRPDIFLLIRVHPREFANRRDSQTSEHAALLAKELEHLPSNARVNWPSDGVSVYDLASDADVFLNAWSTVGKEMAFLGIPVIGYMRDITLYPDDLHAVETEPADYFRAIDKAISEGWSEERARRAWRWGVFEFQTSLLFIEDGYGERESGRDPRLLRRALNKLARPFDPHFKKRCDVWMRPHSLRVASQICAIVEGGMESVLELPGGAHADRVSLEEETAVLRAELARVASAMFTTEEARAKSRLYQRLTGQ